MARKPTYAEYGKSILSLLDDAHTNAEAIRRTTTSIEYSAIFLVDENSVLNQKNARELLAHAKLVRKKLDALIAKSPL